MRSAAIIKIQVAADRCTGLADVVVGSQVNLLVFDAAPQPLDEHIAVRRAARKQSVLWPTAFDKCSGFLICSYKRPGTGLFRPLVA